MPWIAAYTDPVPLPMARPLVWFRDDSDALVAATMPDLPLDGGPVFASELSAATLFLVAGMTQVRQLSITYAEMASAPHAGGKR